MFQRREHMQCEKRERNFASQFMQDDCFHRHRRSEGEIHKAKQIETHNLRMFCEKTRQRKPACKRQADHQNIEEIVLKDIREQIKKMTAEQSPIVLWLKGGGKIYGRVKSLDTSYVVVDVTGEMSEFQSYNALILLDEISAVAWTIPRD